MATERGLDITASPVDQAFYEDLRANMEILIANVAPDKYRARVLLHADAIGSRCFYCKQFYGLKPAGGQPGVSDGCCSAVDCTRRLSGDLLARTGQ